MLKHLEDFDCRWMPRLNSPKEGHTSPHKLSKVFSYAKLSPAHYAFSSVVDQMQELVSYSEAIKYECWRNAIQPKIDSYEENQT